MDLELLRKAKAINDKIEENTQIIQECQDVLGEIPDSLERRFPLVHGISVSGAFLGAVLSSIASELIEKNKKLTKELKEL